jgi:hypothetical protein
VTLTKDIRSDGDEFANDSLYWSAPERDQGLDVLNGITSRGSEPPGVR